MSTVAVAGEAGLVGEVLQPVHEVLAGGEVQGVGIGRVGHDRAELGRVPLAEEVVLLAEPLQVLDRQRAIGDPLPHLVPVHADVGLDLLEGGHELLDRQGLGHRGAVADVLELPGVTAHRSPPWPSGPWRSSVGVS
jgi:hypothetical protein